MERRSKPYSDMTDSLLDLTARGSDISVIKPLGIDSLNSLVRESSMIRASDLDTDQCRVKT